MKIKQQLLSELLDVPYETLRYWRRYVDPVPASQRKSFTTMDLLAFVLVKTLIKVRFMDPNHLARFNISTLFEWLNSVTREEAATKKIALRRSTKKIEIVPKEHQYKDTDLDIDALLVEDAIKEVDHAIWRINPLPTVSKGKISCV